MYDSMARRNIQWSWINNRMKTRSDILPFDLTTSGITISVNGEKYVVHNKEEYIKKIEDIRMKYGDDELTSCSYFINFNKLFDAVETKYRKDMRIKQKDTAAKKIMGQ